jgi:hypothetical protein
MAVASEGRTGGSELDRMAACSYVRFAMPSSPVRQALTFLLAVLVTLSMSLSVVQARPMTAMDASMPAMAKMGMGGSAHDGCKNCATGREGAKAVACGSFCLTPAIAIFATDAFTAPVSASAPTSKLDPTLRGRAPAPEPYPPRPNDLG